MNRILVVFTGGTIGSKTTDATIDVNHKAGFLLIDAFKKKSQVSDIQFDTIQPMNILSENLTPIHWSKLYEVLNETDRSRYDGIIITHGSDTLPYTSAAISFFFYNTRIPIVITASNYPLDCEKSNGLNNFTCSVDFIVHGKIPGIFTIFQNDRGENIVYLASRLMEAESYKDQFFGFGGYYYGEMKDGAFIPKIDRMNPSIDQLLEQRRKPEKENITFQNDVFALRAYPGLNYNLLQWKENPKAILHSLYHSATGCTTDSDYSLARYIKKCKEEGIEFYLISFKDIDRDLYLTSRELLECGAIPLMNISFEAAWVKLCIAYNQTSMKPQEFMEKELFFEFLP